MFQSKHILVALADTASRSAPAIARAAEIAAKTGAQVTLFHSLYSPYLAGEQFYSPVELERDIETAVNTRKEALERLAKLEIRTIYPGHGQPIRHGAEAFIAGCLDNVRLSLLQD